MLFCLFFLYYWCFQSCFRVSGLWIMFWWKLAKNGENSGKLKLGIFLRIKCGAKEMTRCGAVGKGSKIWKLDKSIGHLTDRLTIWLIDWCRSRTIEGVAKDRWAIIQSTDRSTSTRGPFRGFDYSGSVGYSGIPTPEIVGYSERLLRLTSTLFSPGDWSVDKYSRLLQRGRLLGLPLFSEVDYSVFTVLDFSSGGSTTRPYKDASSIQSTTQFSTSVGYSVLLLGLKIFQFCLLGLTKIF